MSTKSLLIVFYEFVLYFQDRGIGLYLSLKYPVMHVVVNFTSLEQQSLKRVTNRNSPPKSGRYCLNFLAISKSFHDT